MHGPRKNWFVWYRNRWILWQFKRNHYWSWRKIFFNLDEVGDVQEITVVVPKSYTKTKIPISFVRRKRCTGLVCISMNGEIPKPLIITQRKTIDSEIFHYVQKSSFNCEFQQNGFITKTIFKRWLINTFIPFVNQQKLNMIIMAILF